MLKKQILKTEAKITFTLPKQAISGAKEVRVLGEFNNWDWEKAPVMKASKANYTATIAVPAGKQYQFRYLADNGVWENDWAADKYIPSEYTNIENSVVEVPAKVVKAKAKKTAKPKKAVAKKVTTKKAAAKKTAKADDLKKIEGIGPKIAGLLNADGIITFAHLAKAPIKQLKTILDNAGSRYRMHDPKTWAAQAKLAAKGDWAALKVWQGELKGGK